MSRKLLLIVCCAAALALSVALAACGSSNSPTTSTTHTVAKTETPTQTTQTDPGVAGEPGEHSSAKSSIDTCLAAHGIKAPSSGDGTIHLPAGVSSEQFRAILASCAHKAGVSGGVTGKGQPPSARDHKIAFERVVQCLRNHGAGLKKNGKIDQQKLKEAEHACRNVLKDTLAGEQATHPSVQNIHIGKIQVGKIKIGKVKIKKLEKLNTAGTQEAEGAKKK